MAQNHMNYIGFGDIDGPTPYEVIRFGDIDGPGPRGYSCTKTNTLDNESCVPPCL